MADAADTADTGLNIPARCAYAGHIARAAAYAARTAQAVGDGDKTKAVECADAAIRAAANAAAQADENGFLEEFLTQRRRDLWTLEMEQGTDDSVGVPLSLFSSAYANPFTTQEPEEETEEE